MITTTRFFEIEKNMLGRHGQRFPFTLYIYSPNNESHTPVLYSNTEYEDQINNTLNSILKKGGKLTIAIDDKDKFLEYFCYNSQDIPGLMERVNKWDQLNIERANDYQKLMNSDFSFISCLKEAIEKEDFKTFNEAIKKEILCFPYHISLEVSNAIALTEEVLKSDDQTAKVLCCSYYFAKKLGYKNREELAALIMAAAFRDIGIGQLPFSPSKPERLINAEENSDWFKHPALSVFVLRKSNFKLSKLALRIILEHHERFDGSGFPHQKKTPYIHPLSELLGLFDTIFRFSDGQVTGHKKNLNNTIISIAKELKVEGLETQFSHHLKSQLLTVAQ